MSTHRVSSRSFALAAAIAAVLTCVQVEAQQRQEAKTDAAAVVFDIPAQPLARALSQYGEVTGFQLVYEAQLAIDKTSTPVSGSFEPREALLLLLTGSGLQYRFSDPRTVIILAPPSGVRTLGPVRVEGADSDSPRRGEGVAQLGGIRGGQDQEARGLRAVTASVGAGAPTAIEDIPRSVSVLTQDQMEAQGVQDFAEAIRRLPGLSMFQRQASTSSNAATGSGDVKARGFAVTKMQIDGGASTELTLLNNGLFSLDEFERVELVRGPNGVFVGNDSPGGSINLVRKRPGGTPSLSVNLGSGSFDQYEGGIDWSTPSLFGSPFAARAGLSHEDKQYKWDNDHLKRTSFHGIVDVPLGDRARFEVGGGYQDIHQNGFYAGSLRYYDGPNLDVPFYFNYTPEWAYTDAKVFNVFGRYFARFFDHWNFDIGANFGVSDRRSLDAVINGMYLVSTTRSAYAPCFEGVCYPTATTLFARETDREDEHLGLDFKVTGNFKTWGLDHSVHVAGDFRETLATFGSTEQWNAAWLNIYSLDEYLRVPGFGVPAPANNVNFAAADPNFRQASSSYSLTVSDVISWRNRIFLNLSTSLQDYDNGGGTVARLRSNGVPHNINLSEINSGSVDRAHGWRPNWSLSAKPIRNMTVYGSYSEGYRDQSTLYTIGGEQLGPATYENAELGVKYAPRDWMIAASGYRLQETNVATMVPGSMGRCPPASTSFCYYLGGAAVESIGYDVEFSGRVFDQLDLQLSYTTGKTERTGTGLPLETRSPDKLGKLFARWDIPWMPSWSVNTSAIYTGRIFEKGTRPIYDPETFELLDSQPYEFAEAATFIWDVGVDYRLDENFSFSLFVENVGDTEYYSTAAAYVNHIGNPRTAMFRVKWQEGGDPSGLTPSPTTGLAPFGDPADWYGSLDFGRQYSRDLEAKSSGKGADGQPVEWTFETTPSVAFAAKLGYRLNDRWRVEGELGQRQQGFGRIGGNDTVPYNLCGLDYASDYLGTSRDRLTQCYEPKGDAKYWSFTANLLRDFGSADWRLRPFLGAGIGLTRASVSFSGRLDGYTDTVYRNWYRDTFGTDLSSYDPVAPGEKVLGSDASWGPSFQLLAGVSWRVTDRATVDLAGKYARDVLDIRTANLSNYYPAEWLAPGADRLEGTGLPPLGSFKGDLDSYTVTLGLRWAFGDRR